MEKEQIDAEFKHKSFIDKNYKPVTLGSKVIHIWEDSDGIYIQVWEDSRVVFGVLASIEQANDFLSLEPKEQEVLVKRWKRTEA